MMEEIRKLFCAYDNKYPFEDMPEVAAALSGLNAYLEKNMDPETFGNAEDMASSLYIKTEMQGFVYGFRFAMRIAAECFAGGKYRERG